MTPIIRNRGPPDNPSLGSNRARNAVKLSLSTSEGVYPAGTSPAAVATPACAMNNGVGLPVAAGANVVGIVEAEVGDVGDHGPRCSSARPLRGSVTTESARLALLLTGSETSQAPTGETTEDGSDQRTEPSRGSMPRTSTPKYAHSTTPHDTMDSDRCTAVVAPVPTPGSWPPTRPTAETSSLHAGASVGGFRAAEPVIDAMR